MIRDVRMVLLLLCGMLLFTACPLHTEHSVDDGSYPVPFWLPGTWQDANSGDKYQVSTDGHNASAVTICKADSEGFARLSTRHRAVFSKVMDKVFVSIYEPASTDKKQGYYILQFWEVNTEEFKLVGIKENLVPYTVADLKSFLGKNLDKEIYDPAQQYDLVKQ